MGKFSSGMKKYGHGLESAFTWDDDERKQLRKANKLNHAEAVVTLPARLILDPVIGAGALAGGVVVGGICIPLGVLFSKGLLEFGALALTGGVLLGIGGIVVCPIANIITAPYNAVKAFKHRERKEHHSAPQDIIETVDPSSSHTKMKELGGPINDAHINDPSPENRKPLFEAKNDSVVSTPTVEETATLRT